MTRKSVGITVGILGVVLLGGLVAFLPQRAGGQDEPKPKDENAFRERESLLRSEVIELRSRIEDLRMENEAARPHLLAMMKLRERIAFLEEAGLLTPAGSVLKYSEAINGDLDSLKEALAAAMTAIGPEEDFQKKLDESAKEDLDQIRPTFQAALYRMKVDFAKRRDEIARAEFDLAEAEQHYQTWLESAR